MPTSSNDFVNKYILFEPPLTGFTEIWKVVVTWNVVAFGFLYLVCGLIAACVFRRHRSAAVAIPVVSTLFGALIGFAGGALLSLIAAAIYSAGPFAMQWWMGLAWGLGLCLIYTIHSLTKFVF
eukprot:m51a1_g4416 hypothetical protein (123) ;mRNA; f:7974-8488